MAVGPWQRSDNGGKPAKDSLTDLPVALAKPSPKESAPLTPVVPQSIYR
jgi:hypothetical protein